MRIEKNWLVVKSNKLNELCGIFDENYTDVKLQEIKLFLIYLSKVNPLDYTNSPVRIYLNEYLKILGLGRQPSAELYENADLLFKREFFIPLGENGYERIHIFSTCKYFHDENGNWFFELKASPDALSHICNLKDRYTKYELWNILPLRSAAQIRLYEILKQHENNHRWEFKLCELRERLFISPSEYTGRNGWTNFRLRVLDPARDAINAMTDIFITYERGEIGPGGVWKSIVFHIRKNKNYRNKFKSVLQDVTKESVKELSENPEDDPFNLIDRTIIERYREHETVSLVSDFGILKFDRKLRNGAGLSLNQRVRVYLELLEKAEMNSLDEIREWDCYLLACLKNWITRRKYEI